MTMIMQIVTLVVGLLLSKEMSKAENEINDVLSTSNGIFTSKVYNAVSSESGNVLISPLSLNLALTVTSFGTSGNTLKELRSTLNQPEDENKIIESYKNFSDSVNNDKYLAIANKVYVDEKFQLKSEFQTKVTKDFDAGVQNVDFFKAPETARQTINTFVDNKTNHLIKELYEPGTISQDTQSVIINVVYFKSKWLHPFNVKATQKKPFYGLDKNHEVDMMFLADTRLKYGFNSELNAELLELPYERDFTFQIILPKEKKGIAEVQNKIKTMTANGNSSPFQKIFENLTYNNVDVYLPKFKFEQTHSLVPVLQQLGIKDIFGQGANFQRMTDQHLAVSDVIQKVYINVNEESTEAAAATGINVVYMSAIQDFPQIFNAEHPFVYVIKQESSNTQLFVGRYMNL